LRFLDFQPDGFFLIGLGVVAEVSRQRDCNALSWMKFRWLPVPPRLTIPAISRSLINSRVFLAINMVLN
jgi:hypothetical protein